MVATNGFAGRAADRCASGADPMDYPYGDHKQPPRRATSDGTPAQNDRLEAKAARGADPRSGRWIGSEYVDEDRVPALSDLVDD